MKILIRHFTVCLRFLTLTLSILITSVKKEIHRRKKVKIQHPHLKDFKDKKHKNKCNLNTLSSLLNKKKSNRLLVSDLVNAQQTYQCKKKLLGYLPQHSETTEIVAIPIAIKAFSFFRHFVTIIVDRKAGIIEFYDPIGFTSYQYKNAVLWGPKCAKRDLLSLVELLIAVKERYQIDTLIESTSIHQKDCSQCALFVYDRIYKRGVRGLTFEQAAKRPLTSIQAYT